MQQHHIHQSLQFLQNQLRPDGGLDGWSGKESAVFRPSRRLPTIFAAALVARCLGEVTDSKAITTKLTTYLHNHRSSSWTWNYWERNARGAAQPAYPDDLDDTANALIALHIHDGSLSGEALGHVAQTLVQTEQQPGGPYRTWLVPPRTVHWDDTDIAVNANVGKLLALQGVSLAPLESYIAHCLTTDALDSPYYVGAIPTLYFLASWYRGSAKLALRNMICKQLTQPEKHNALMLSLLVSAGHHLEVSSTLLGPAVTRILQLRRAHCWPAEALYVDPTIKGTTYHAGSKALTTAFALEALQLVRQAPEPVMLPATPVSVPTCIATAQKLSSTLPIHVGNAYRTQLDRIAQLDTSHHITAMVDVVARAYDVKLPVRCAEHLRLASLNGWIAYTVYDDFLDQEGKPEELGAANVALRQTAWHFSRALPNHPSFSQLVSQTLNTVDDANTWEVTQARARRQGTELQFSLPDFDDYRQLAHKSLGHMLVAYAVALYSGQKTSSPAFGHLRDFFVHFLIARQLHDDAHDWQEDLEQGHLSAVVCLLLARHSSPITVPNPQLSEQFWRDTVVAVVAMIMDHIRLARAQLPHIGASQAFVLEALLQPLERAAQQTLRAHRDATDFIASYHQKSGQHAN